MKVEGHQSNLALFAPVKVDTGIEKIEWVDYRPISPISRGSVIDFFVPGNGQNYIDLGKTKLYIKVRIVKKDGSPITVDDKVSFINLPHAALFKQCEIQLQHVNIETSNSYGYIGVLNAYLNYSEDELESKRQSELFFKDTPLYMDCINPLDGGNFGLIQRWASLKDRICVDLQGSIHSGLFEQDRLLPNGISVHIKFYPSPDAFVLMASDPNYMVDIIELKLKVCNVTVNSDVIVAHAETLKKVPAIIPFTENNIKTFSIPSGMLSWNGENIYTGDIPNKVVVALTSAEGFSGSFTKNPFNFEHFNLSSIGFYVDGVSLPGPPLKVNYREGNYVEPYFNMFSGKKGNYISRDDFVNGYAIYVFDLDSTGKNDVTSKSKKGHTRLSIEFAESLPKAVNVIVYSHFNKILEIDYARNVNVKSV